MQVHVKTPRTEIEMKGDIPEKIINLLKEVYGKKVTLSDDDEYINIRKTEWYKKVFRENRDYLWPIPGSEIDINPLMTQNPGWN